jgi:hypothetical protein
MGNRTALFCGDSLRAGFLVARFLCMRMILLQERVVLAKSVSDKRKNTGFIPYITEKRTLAPTV